MNVTWGFSTKDTKLYKERNVDPLGFLLVWPELAKQCIPSLNTQITGVRNLIVFMVFIDVIEEIRRHHDFEFSRYPKQQQQQLFLVFEWLLVHLIVNQIKNNDLYIQSNLLGKDAAKRQKKDLSEYYYIVPLSKNTAPTTNIKILQDQKWNGIWGTHKTALVNLKLLKESNDGFVITDAGSLFLEKFNTDKQYSIVKKGLIQWITQNTHSDKDKIYLKISEVLTYQDFISSMLWLRSNEIVKKTADTIRKWFDQNLILKIENILQQNTLFTLNSVRNIVKEMSNEGTERKKWKILLEMEQVLSTLEGTFYWVLTHKSYELPESIWDSITSMETNTPSFGPHPLKNLFKGTSTMKSSKLFVQGLLTYHKVIMADRRSIPWMEEYNGEIKVNKLQETPEYLQKTLSMEEPVLQNIWGRHLYIKVVYGLLKDIHHATREDDND